MSGRTCQVYLGDIVAELVGDESHEQGNFMFVKECSYAHVATPKAFSAPRLLHTPTRA